MVDAETGQVKVVEGNRYRPVQDLDGRLQALRDCGARAVAIGTDEDAYTALHRHFRAQRSRR